MRKRKKEGSRNTQQEHFKINAQREEKKEDEGERKRERE